MFGKACYSESSKCFVVGFSCGKLCLTFWERPLAFSVNWFATVTVFGFLVGNYLVQVLGVCLELCWRDGRISVLLSVCLSLVGDLARKQVLAVLVEALLELGTVSSRFLGLGKD